MSSSRKHVSPGGREKPKPGVVHFCIDTMGEIFPIALPTDIRTSRGDTVG